MLADGFVEDVPRVGLVQHAAALGVEGAHRVETLEMIRADPVRRFEVGAVEVLSGKRVVVWSVGAAVGGEGETKRGGSGKGRRGREEGGGDGRTAVGIPGSGTRARCASGRARMRERRVVGIIVRVRVRVRRRKEKVWKKSG